MHVMGIVLCHTLTEILYDVGITSFSTYFWWRSDRVSVLLRTPIPIYAGPVTAILFVVVTFLPIYQCKRICGDFECLWHGSSAGEFVEFPIISNAKRGLRPYAQTVFILVPCTRSSKQVELPLVGIALYGRYACYMWYRVLVYQLSHTVLWRRGKMLTITQFNCPTTYAVFHRRTVKLSHEGNIVVSLLTKHPGHFSLWALPSVPANWRGVFQKQTDRSHDSTQCRRASMCQYPRVIGQGRLHKRCSLRHCQSNPQLFRPTPCMCVQIL